MSKDTNIDRQTNFSTLKATMLSSYAIEFVDREDDTLLIVLSPTRKFALFRYPFNYSCLFIADLKVSYYLLHPHRQAEFLKSFILKSGYKKVIFLGSSKGGTGALLWSALLKKCSQTIDIGCLAFSPQTMIYPENSNIAILPTYAALIKRMKLSSIYKLNLEHFGNIVKLVNKYQPRTRLVYSAQYEMDCVEALRFADNPWIRLVPIPFSFHGALVPFVVDKKNKVQLVNIAKRLAKEASKDIDLDKFLPPTVESFVDYFENVEVPSLNDYINDFLKQHNTVIN